MIIHLLYIYSVSRMVPLNHLKPSPASSVPGCVMLPLPLSRRAAPRVGGGGASDWRRMYRSHVVMAIDSGSIG